MNRTLIILVTNYPYGYGEHFMENELVVLAKEFKSIYIVATDQNYIGSKVAISKIPENVQLIEYVEQISSSDKFLSIRHLFSKIFLDDVLLFKKFNIQFYKIFLMEFLKSKKLSKFLKNFIKRQKIKTDECYIYSYWNDFMSAAIANVKIKIPEIKGFSRAHGWDVYCERHPLNYLPLRTHIVKNLDKIFFISQNGVLYYNKLIPKYSNKYIYSALGTRNSLTPQTHVISNTFTMVSCSSIIPLKNLWLMIDALALIDTITIHWIHLGTGIEEDEIKKYAHEKLYSKSNISYDFRGFIFNDKILEFYRNQHVDFLLNCSTTEGVPVSMMEAMSFGIPVIGTNVGGVSEIIENAKNGFLMSTYPTKEEVAETIEKFCNLSFDETQKLRDNAYNTWNYKFNAEINYLEFIQQITK